MERLLEPAAVPALARNPRMAGGGRRGRSATRGPVSRVLRGRHRPRDLDVVPPGRVGAIVPDPPSRAGMDGRLPRTFRPTEHIGRAGAPVREPAAGIRSPSAT